MFADEPEARLTPDDLVRLEQALDRACADATLTGAAGREIVYRLLLARYRQQASNEELQRQAAKLIAQRRGLPVKASPPGRTQRARRRS